MSGRIVTPGIPTRAEMRSALYAHQEAERAWRELMDARSASILNGTPWPEVDVVELHAACSQAWRRLTEIADRLPEGTP